MISTPQTKLTDTFFVLDFDRCLGNNAVYQLLEICLGDFVDMDAYRSARRAVETSGGSFDVFAWLRREQGFRGPEFSTLEQRYQSLAKEQGSDTFLSTGAAPLLDFLVQSQLSFMIMTFGGREYQTMKLKAAGLDGYRFEIVDRKDKSSIINSWWHQKSGRFHVPEVSQTAGFRRVCLVDDKPAAFVGLHKEAIGYLVKTNQKTLPSQLGAATGSVQTCHSLTEVLKDIQNL